MSKSVLFKPTISALFSLIILTFIFDLSSANAQNSELDIEKQLRYEVEINQLIAIVGNQGYRESNPEQVTEAIDRLGKLKAVEAIPALIEIITFKVQPKAEVKSGFFGIEHHTINNFDRFPAMQALFDIGKPAFPALIEVIKKEESGSLASENAFEVLRSFFVREDSEQGIKYLRENAAEALSEDEKQRLNAAAGKLTEVVERLKKYDESKSRKEKP